MNQLIQKLTDQLTANKRGALILDIFDARQQLDIYQLKTLAYTIRRDTITKSYIRIPRDKKMLAISIARLNGVCLVTVTRQGKRYLQFRGFTNDALLAVAMYNILLARLKARAYKQTLELKWRLFHKVINELEVEAIFRGWNNKQVIK